MKNRMLDLAIIGSGPAGLAAAVKARELGIDDMVVFERNSRPGGILNQCIHNGFGIDKFKEELTGPEYATRYIRMAEALVRANKRFDFFVFPGQRHGYGNMGNYWFWPRAEYFAKHLLGDERTAADITELNNEQEQSRGGR